MVNRALVSILVLVALKASAQFTNDWVNPNQQYFKLQVVQDGWYRVTNTELVSAGVPISSINPARVQLFHRGKEVAISTETSNNLLTAFEFYGRRNDGILDQTLYQAPQHQPNSNYSLFTDTASYFLTWSLTQNGKRIQNDPNQAKTVSTEAYFLEKLMIQQTSSYSEGQKYGPENELSSGTFAAGEGWTGALIGKTGSESYFFDLPNKVTSGAKPSLVIGISGRNNLDHNVEISVGPTVSSQRVIGNATFTGYVSNRFSSEFEWTDVGADNKCVVVVRAVGYTGMEEYISVSYVELTYPRQFSITSSSTDVYDLQATANDRYVISIPTTNAATIKVLNITDPYTVVNHPTIKFSDRLEAVIGASASKFIAVSAAMSVPKMRAAITTYIDPGSANYLIITNRKLRETASTGVDQVLQYETYRKSVSGGGFDVYTAHIQEIYDQFSYGNPSPLAIRNYFDFALSKSEVRFGLVIGKGLNLKYKYGRGDPGYPHFVPTYGYPGSDVLFSVAEGQDIPRFPVGRVNAQSATDIRNYLDKIKAMESQGYTELWRKNLIHISGGQNQFELTSFYNNIIDLKNIAEYDYLGGRVSIRRKATADPVDGSINVTDRVNQGVSLITFFGHSGSFTQDVEIGNPRRDNNPKGFANTGKYPVLLINGCNSGSIFDENDSYIDDWVIVGNLGAQAGIAHVDLATSQSLRNYSNLFYDYAFRRPGEFGRSIGEIHIDVMTSYFSVFGTSDLSKSMLYGMLLIGDPAVKVFGAQAPDYSISNGDIYTSQNPSEKPLSTSASFPLFLVVRNYGRTVFDSLDVKVDRTLPDGSVHSYHQKFMRPLYQDTLRFEIPNEAGFRYEGQNSLVVTLDPADSVEELSKANNQAFFSLFLAKGSTLNLFPRDFGLVDTTVVKLQFQPLDILLADQPYSLEIDTTATFSSLYATSQTISGSVLLSRELNLADIPDSTVIYWRTRFAEPKTDEDTSWVSSSFVFIRNAGTGWGVKSNAQFGDLSMIGVKLNQTTGQWTYDQTESAFQIVVYGRDTPGNYSYSTAHTDFHVVINGNDLMITDLAFNPLCRTDVMGAIFFDRETSQPFSPFGTIPDEVSNPLVCGQQPQLIFNLTETDILGANRYLDSLINQLDPGDGMIFFTLGDVIFSNWDAQTKASLNQIGVRTTTINSLTNGQPVIFYGRKGFLPGEAVEIVSNGSGIPLPDQLLDYDGSFTGTRSSGTIKTQRIGPAKVWKSLEYVVEETVGDQIDFSVVGINAEGNEVQLFEGNRVGQVDLSTVDAGEYPTLSLTITESDNTSLSPPTLKSVLVKFDPVPEGVLSSVSSGMDERQEGQEYSRSFRFENISDVEFEDSLEVTYNLINISSGNTISLVTKEPAPLAGDTLILTANFSTLGNVGLNNLSVSVLPAEAESYMVNNQVVIGQAVNVLRDETNPVMDVTFDGTYILDGDIVSPNPVVKIRFRDENPYLFKSDTAGISISLKSPCDNCQFQAVSFTDSKISYTPASEQSDFEILYQPGPLEDGDYGLRVTGADQSGNQSGAEPFEINFKVINESTVTHFFPYPNPFSTSTRFVFTLTGGAIPEEIKIQIMTVTGRIVREITQDEIGPLKIGQNITQYAWDGRDEYGDQLANGVYLYKVTMRNAGERVKHRFTSADRAFKQGFGKIYLLR